ncbi:MAG TPA: nitroreductase family protein [Candidatus Thermoplasmatota archaeon]|nr:nitroreductase family protein [Candidatus Thermoplasmatota archaeon]
MNDLDVFLSRRSIRRYKQESIEPDVMIQLVKAGMAAPSAFNQQPWEFVIVHETKLLEKIAKLHPFASMARYAAGFIIVCGLPKKDTLLLDMWPQDCAAVTENVLLAAHKIGLGAVWIGIYPNEKHMSIFKKVCHIPKEVIPFSGVCFGIPDTEKPPADRFDESRIHWNSWE